MPTDVLQETDSDTARLARVRGMAQTGLARNVRLWNGLSLRDMARPVEVTPSTILRWENGQRRPRGDAALRYLDLLEELLRQ